MKQVAYGWINNETIATVLGSLFKPHEAKHILQTLTYNANNKDFSSPSRGWNSSTMEKYIKKKGKDPVDPNVQKFETPYTIWNKYKVISEYVNRVNFMYGTSLRINFYTQRKYTMNTKTNKGYTQLSYDFLLYFESDEMLSKANNNYCVGIVNPNVYQQQLERLKLEDVPKPDILLLRT